MLVIGVGGNGAVVQGPVRVQIRLGAGADQIAMVPRIGRDLNANGGPVGIRIDFPGRLDQSQILVLRIVTSP